MKLQEPSFLRAREGLRVARRQLLQGRDGFCLKQPPV
jgi:hypothetical protein